MGEPCPSNISVWDPVSLSTGDEIKADHINQLRQAVNREKTRRESFPVYNTMLDVGVIDLAEHIESVKNEINNMKSFLWTQNFTGIQGSLIYAAQIMELRQNMNDLEDDCLCNCNYCTCDCNYCTCDCNHTPCGCNYCTCDCNYCTCNCNHCPCVSYCSCNCNYACTCNCNYCSCVSVCNDYSSSD